MVRLELPDAGNRPSERTDTPPAPTLDPHRLAHAVEDLIRAIDPTLAGARVQIEVTQDRSRIDRPDPTRPATPSLASARSPENGQISARDNGFRPTAGAEARAGTEPDRQSDVGSDAWPEPPDAPQTHPELGLDRAGRTLVVDGRTVALTRREFDLLAYLQDHRGVALGRRDLMTAVWQTDYLVGDRTIDVHVRRLRVKLGRHADRLSTLRGYGYRLD